MVLENIFCIPYLIFTQAESIEIYLFFIFFSPWKKAEKDFKILFKASGMAFQWMMSEKVDPLINTHVWI